MSDQQAQQQSAPVDDTLPEEAPATLSDLELARALASHEMEGEEHRRERELAQFSQMNTDASTTTTGTPGNDLSITLAKQRQLAEAAMEGPERRREREMRESAEKARLESLAKQKDELARRARLKMQEEEEMKRIMSEARERQHTAIEEQHTTVEELAHNPAISIRPVRTFKEDMNEAIKGNNISLVSMAIKESERKREEEDQTVVETKKSHLFAIVSAVLILAGLVVGGYVLYIQFFEQATPEDITQNRTGYQSLVFAEQVKETPTVDLSGSQLLSILRNEVKNLNAPLGTIEDVHLIEDKTTLKSIDVARFSGILELHTPSSLLRNLKTNFMFGVHSSEESTGFLVMQSDNYDRVFAGMLAWEPSMVRDLYSILSGRSPTSELIATPFTDVVIKNIEVRAVRDASGKIMLLYAFFNRDTLIVTTKEATLVEILSRLTTPRPVLQR